MNLSAARHAASSAKRQIKAHGRGGGPNTEQGKLRSSLNAVRHGLSGKHLLLPAEDPQEYAAKMDAIFATLAPKNEGEAQVVALIGDDMFKLDRLERIETSLSIARIEQLLGQTGSAERAARTASALQTFGTAIQAWDQKPVPSERTPDVEKNLKKLIKALADVSERMPALPGELVEACEPHIHRLLHMPSEGGIFSPEAYQALSAAAGKVMWWLLHEAEREDAAQTELRKAIAGLALPDEVELRKLARYRKILEDGLQRRLLVLDQMRKLTESRPAEQGGEQAKAFRVQLRLVR